MKIEIKQNVALSDLSAYGTGGPALFLGEAHDWASMLGLREFADMQDLPFEIIGQGSNTLFPDYGFEGLVIVNRMNHVQFQDNSIEVESGVNVLQLILAAGENNLGGLSALAATPGTINDALNQEGPALEAWIGDLMHDATILSEKTNAPTVVSPDYFKYRRRKKEKDIILSVKLRLEEMPKQIVRTELSAMLSRRALGEPTNIPGGHFFENPEGFPSAKWLIESSGCNGLQIGGAMVSEKNPSYIVNTGKASTEDVMKLSKKVHQIVKQKYKVNLQPIANIVS